MKTGAGSTPAVLQALTVIPVLAMVILPAFIITGPAWCQEDDASRNAALEKIRGLHERLQLAPRDSYLNYAISTLARRNHIDLEREDIKFPLVPVLTDDPDRRVDLFRLATGSLALHESLQLTELLMPRRSESKAEVLLSELEPPDLPSLPYDALIAGRDIAFNDEARLVPGDWAYLRFKDGGELLAFLEEADRWIHHALVFYGEDPRDREILWRHTARLGLPDPRKFPDLFKAVPGPIALTMSDLFIREGTDITVILPEGVPGFLFPEGRTARFRTAVEGRVVLSTSKRALDRVVGLAMGATGEAAEGAAGEGSAARVPDGSLASQADFKHMRELLPAGGEESAFLFLSDAFLRRLVGPRLRILESRRVRCASHLRTLVNAGLLFAEERGRKAAGVEELIDQGYLEADKLVCPHGGTYALEGGFQASCSVHHRMRDLTPNIELDLEKVTEGEAWAYRRFARAYTNFWRRYFDPVGISIRREGGTFAMDVMVLPLADNSLYRNLTSLAGGMPLKGGAGPIAPTTIFLGSSKVDRSFLKRLDARIFRSDRVDWDQLRKDFEAGFKDRITMGLLDDQMLFDFDISGFVGQAIRWNMARDVILAPLLAAANLPAYAVFLVDDPSRAAHFLEVLREGALLEGSRPEGGQFTLKVEAYDLPGGEGTEGFQALTLEIFSFKFRLFYKLHGGALIVSTRPDVLEKVVREAVPDPDDRPYNMKVSLYPKRWKAIKADMLISYAEAARKSCLKSLWDLQPFAASGLESAQEALGFPFRCPDGGAYEVGEDGFYHCGIHGIADDPRQLRAPGGRNPTARLVEELEEVAFSLRFTEEGIHCTIVVRK